MHSGKGAIMPVTAVAKSSALQIGAVALPAPAGLGPVRKRMRSDALPEFTRYRDKGCDVHSNCLTCPLPRCRYEEPGGLRALLNEYRDRQIVSLRRKGASVDELAGQYGISRRTIFRVLGNRKTAQQSRTITAIRAPNPSRRPGRDDDERIESRCA
jgi:hypothetical protein